MKKIQAQLARSMDFLGQCPLVVVTARRGALNYAMPVAWVMGSDYDPPRVAMTLGAWNATYPVLLESSECVLNVVPPEFAREVFELGSTHCDGKADKLARFGLAWQNADSVNAAVLEGAFAALECRVVKKDESLGLFILKGLCFWLAEDWSAERYHVLHSLGDVLYSDDGRRFARADLLSEKA
ncbi:flavin reductase family protein [Mesosutterella sp. OilRF-GAM-744-9]|uniref:Flavin reductase family protein n=1 Tax=Mesosutterella porci TaxID=2915351 RepID=A0ABS9MS79_9BURK|nr:flavin reductase family protein [Mesosutterella sp. oilRF-744-WT-GAM-9]MCG5031382.1 flavin reductase family protein [Mesosutterella sp. oilRF-744-WT-GAM-9]